jgi:SIR2-like protein
MSHYKDILGQLDDGYAMLFLGAGSTRNCRRPDGRGGFKRGFTGDDLAREILTELNDGVDPQLKNVGLTQASEFYASTSAGARAGLDRLIQDRLSDLRPIGGHYLAASFPWRAVVTTNYNRVAEDAWAEAHAGGYAANELLAIRTDADIIQHSGDTKRTRLYKPHGCVTIRRQPANRMVLTSLDYFESERIRKAIYESVRSLARDCSTVFVGYSLNDHTFRNIFYTLYQELGQWAARSYSVGPIDNPTYEEWLTRSMDENFKTRVINESFDTFMLRLTIDRGQIHRNLKAKVLALWDEMEADNASHMRGLKKEDIAKLPET